MRLCYRRYIEGTRLESSPQVTVLDVGGANVNGSYREIFNGPPFKYIVADIAPAIDVDIVMSDPYRLPLENSTIDIVICGQMLEHCEFFWLAFAEMMRVVSSDGFLFLIAPSAGPEHRYPVDCYRFYPDAYRALAKYANCVLMEAWCDERGPWRDLVGVFRRHRLPKLPQLKQDKELRDVPPDAVPSGSAEEEATRGAVTNLEILAALHRQLEPSLYLEIGVGDGSSLSLARCPAIGVDPLPRLRGDMVPTSSLAVMTSDDFFAGPHRQLIGGVPDLIFIDGMRLFELTLRDFMHIERISGPGTMLALGGVCPNHPAQALRRRRTRAWFGDVWKMLDCLKEWRPDLFLLALDAAPAGMLLVAGLDPGNRVLWDNYNYIVRHFAMELEHAVPPLEVMERRACSAGEGRAVAKVCGMLRQCRAARLAPPEVASRLSQAARVADRF
jgi:hypothetical protein